VLKDAYFQLRSIVAPGIRSEEGERASGSTSANSEAASVRSGVPDGRTGSECEVHVRGVGPPRRRPRRACRDWKSNLASTFVLEPMEDKAIDNCAHDAQGPAFNMYVSGWVPTTRTEQLVTTAVFHSKADILLRALEEQRVRQSHRPGPERERRAKRKGNVRERHTESSTRGAVHHRLPLGALRSDQPTSEGLKTTTACRTYPGLPRSRERNVVSVAEAGAGQASAPIRTDQMTNYVRGGSSWVLPSLFVSSPHVRPRPRHAGKPVGRERQAATGGGQGEPRAQYHLTIRCRSSTSTTS